MSRFFASRIGIIVSGAIIGALAALLVLWGNPPNMGICVACFTRDTAGALGLHRAATVQYIRPELIGFILGALLGALLFKEFKPRSGSAPLIRFVLGFFAIIGALVFLGCPWRAYLRLAGGDLNALLGIAGFIVGVAIGVFFLKRGYSLGRSRPVGTAVGLVMPVFALILLLLLLFRVSFGENAPIFFSKSGPGSLHAPILISLAVGIVAGFLAQRTRFCTMGAIRDVIIMRDFHLLSGVLAFIVAAFLVNLAIGKFHPGFAPQPIAHSNHLWNFLGMVLAGMSFALAGGCPGRQFFMAGEGDGDAAIFIFGMLVGAAFVHNFNLAGVPDKIVDGKLVVGGPSLWGQIAVIVGLIIVAAIGWTMREK